MMPGDAACWAGSEEGVVGVGVQMLRSQQRRHHRDARGPSIASLTPEMLFRYTSKILGGFYFNF